MTYSQRGVMKLYPGEDLAGLINMTLGTAYLLSEHDPEDEEFTETDNPSCAATAIILGVPRITATQYFPADAVLNGTLGYLIADRLTHRSPEVAR